VRYFRSLLGERTFYTAFFRDVSHEHDAHEKLFQTLEQALDAVIVIDSRDQVVAFNRAAEALWALPREDVLGKSVGTLFSQGDLRGLESLDDNGELAKLGDSSYEISVVRPTGETRTGLLSLSRIRLGLRTHHAALIKDVTEQRRQDQQLRRLSMVVNESDNAIIVTDASGKITYINGGATRMLGYEPEDVLGKRPTDVLVGRHTDRDTTRLIQEIRSPLGEKLRGLQYDVLIYAKTGHPLWVSAVINSVHDEAGFVCNFLGVLTDITHTKMHEVLQHKVLEAIVREVPVREVMTLLCREVERIAPEVVASVLALDADGCLRTLAAPSLPAATVEAIDGFPAGPCTGCCGTAAWSGEVVVCPDIASDPLWVGFTQLVLPHGLLACWSSPIKAKDGTVIGTFAFYYRERRGPSPFHERLVKLSVHLCTLLLEREINRARIHQLAFFDSLTGLPNRAMLHAKAENLLLDTQASGATAAVLFVDLNRFKQVNDSQGHAGGDQLLRVFARRFQASVREGDLVGRLAGDEFVAVLPHCSVQGVTNVLDQLLAEFRKPVVIFGATVHCSASVGVAMFPEHGGDIETLLRRADIAMYRAKSSNPHPYRFFRAEMETGIKENSQLEADLQTALEQDHLHLHFQPQVTAFGDRALYGVEVLARWQHVSLGDVPPTRFVLLAEECGLVVELGEWVLDRACRQLAAWRTRGIAVPRISVNLSASHFQDPGLPDLLAQTLRRYCLEMQDLTLEITEGVLLSDSLTVLATLGTIRDCGIRLSLDDFGAGYSSLGHLHRLPFGELKLDKSFIQDLEGSHAARALVRSVLRIGESLNMTVVAEGVETQGQREFLVREGCPILQGFLLSRPLSAPELEQWIAARI